MPWEKGFLRSYANSEIKMSLWGHIQSNFDGSFTMAYSNSFLSPYEIFPITQENKYWGKISNFIMKLYVVCTH